MYINKGDQGLVQVKKTSRFAWLLKECLPNLMESAGKWNIYHWYSHSCPQSSQAPPQSQGRIHGGIKINS